MAGKMKNCSSCGKVFIAINNSRVCPDCREKEEQWEKEIIEYVREHPKSQIPEIVEATGVQEPIIRRMIREGRFLSSNVELFYPCEKCGSPIQKGQYCDKCPSSSPRAGGEPPSLGDARRAAVCDWQTERLGNAHCQGRQRPPRLCDAWRQIKEAHNGDARKKKILSASLFFSIKKVKGFRTEIANR